MIVNKSNLQIENKVSPASELHLAMGHTFSIIDLLYFQMVRQNEFSI